MTPEQIHARLKGRFGDAIGELAPALDSFCTVTPERLHEVGTFLRDDPELCFDHLVDVTATDHPGDGRIRTVYHLFSYPKRHGFVVKAELDRENPRVSTVEDIWKSANWFEREVWDLFGVVFEGHPDLRRIMLPEDWAGHPLRKDYQEAGGYQGISNVRESLLESYKALDLSLGLGQPVLPEGAAAAGGGEGADDGEAEESVA